MTPIINYLCIILTWTIVSVIVGGVIIAVVTKIVNDVIKPMRLITDGPDLEELANTLDLIIGLEINTFENDLFDKKPILNNSSFENYYIEMCSHITNSLSPSFIERMSYIMTQEELGTIIAKYVKNYLVKKVAIKDNSDEEEDDNKEDKSFWS